ncbi:MAG: glutaredoxin family protein, partial [Deltaproteobacteria bacterium]|nr:glutaredoxin family protein [Deltaproteobacteria bacterium]
MTLFTKENCGKCDNIKRAFDLKELGIEVEVIKLDDAEVLAHLAWHELIE